jgi:hypothetical protein
MLSLIKDFAITALIIILNHWIYGVEDVIAYDFVVGFISSKQALFLTIGILGSAALLIFSSMDGLGLYKITYGLSKLFVRLSQFFITFLCILNIVFYSAMSTNIMRDSGYVLLLALILILGSSCWSLRIIDFNYHTRNALLPIGILAFLSVVLVEYVWPMAGF